MIERCTPSFRYHDQCPISFKNYDLVFMRKLNSVFMRNFVQKLIFLNERANWFCIDTKLM